MDNSAKVIIDKNLLNGEFFTAFRDSEINDWRGNSQCVVFGVIRGEKMTSAGTIFLNPDHIYIGNITGNFINDGAIIDTFIEGFARGVQVAFLAIDAGRDGVGRVLAKKHGFTVNPDTGEYIREVPHVRG